MNINILHIDDSSEVLAEASEIINGHEIDGHTLHVRDSCGFEEGIEKLLSSNYDLVILDLCVGRASSVSEKVGEVVFGRIQETAFVPVVFFTGLPEYVRQFESGIVKITGKAIGYDGLFAQIESLIRAEFIQLKDHVNAIVSEGLRSYFWNFVHRNTGVIEDLRGDPTSLRYILLRRLGKTFSKELTRVENLDPDFQPSYCHPMEFYIYPDIEGEYEAGDLIKNGDQEFFVILTPSCDLVKRGNGSRNAEAILLIRAINFKELPDYQKYKQLKKGAADAEASGEELKKEVVGQIKNLALKLKEWISPGKKERYFFLPKTPFIPALLIDFQIKRSVSYEVLENEFTPVASLDDPIGQAVQASYTRYYSRIGYQDLDIEYAFSQLDSD